MSTDTEGKGGMSECGNMVIKYRTRRLLICFSLVALSILYLCLNAIHYEAATRNLDSLSFEKYSSLNATHYHAATQNVNSLSFEKYSNDSTPVVFLERNETVKMPPPPPFDEENVESLNEEEAKTLASQIQDSLSFEKYDLNANHYMLLLRTSIVYHLKNTATTLHLLYFWSATRLSMPPPPPFDEENVESLNEEEAKTLAIRFRIVSHSKNIAV